jgi:hypothetical protein
MPADAAAPPQVGINSVSSGDGQPRLYKLTPSLVPTAHMASLAVAVGAAAGVKVALGPDGAVKAVPAAECWRDLNDTATTACTLAEAPSAEAQRRRAEADLLEMLERDRQAAACAGVRKASAAASAGRRRRQQPSQQPRGGSRVNAASSAGTDHTVDKSLEELVLAPSTPIDASELQCAKPEGRRAGLVGRAGDSG